MNTLIIGAGRIGQAFKYMSEKNAARVDMYDSDASKIPDQLPLATTVPLADVIFLCIPSWTTRAVLADIKTLLRPETIVISVAKGIEKDSLKTLDHIIVESLPEHQAWGLIIGPMLAEEIVRGQGSAGVLASLDARAYERVRELIDSHDLRLEYSPDVRGAALCGVLKNIYALGLGIASGLTWGDNRKGWLVTHAIREMRAIVHELGGNPETVDGPAGLGDLVATGFSPYSRNRATGDQLVKTGDMNPLSEGYVSIMSLIALLGDTDHYPLLTAIRKIVESHIDAAAVYEQLL